MKMQVFKVYDRERKLFSKGGQYCDGKGNLYWGPKGKTWNSGGAVRLFLSLYVCRTWGEYDITKIPAEWDVVETYCDSDTKEFDTTVLDARTFYLLSNTTLLAKKLAGKI